MIFPKKTAALAIITAGIVLTATAAKPSDSPPPAPAPAPIVLHEATVIHALSAKARIVAPTGEVTKTISQQDDNFWGHRDYKMTVHGDYVLGVDTQDIRISVSGNTVNVKMPDPQIVSLDLPFDKMTQKESKSLLRKELPDSEKKELYTKAESAVRAAIEDDTKLQAQAEGEMVTAVRGLLLKINGVESVLFED